MTDRQDTVQSFYLYLFCFYNLFLFCQLFQESIQITKERRIFSFDSRIGFDRSCLFSLYSVLLCPFNSFYSLFLSYVLLYIFYSLSLSQSRVCYLNFFKYLI